MSPGVLRRFRWPSAWPWAPFFNYFDQSKFVRGIGLSPLERGDEFGMGNGWIHKDSIVKSAIFCTFSCCLPLKAKRRQRRCECLV